MASEPQNVEPTSREGVRETIESIIVALILAFVFRAFVVEAFVIPTGSMAPTLYGAHGTIICEDCGTEFAYGLKDLNDQRKTVLVGSKARAICPNCNYANTRLKTNDQRRNPETGDRILVLKWPLDFGFDFLKPARWDVTVFKDPSDGVTNFIKRLVGLPNEVLMIVDGDLYTVPITELSGETVAELDQLRHEKFELRTGRREGRLRQVPEFVFEELDRKLSIARKTPEAQEALWFTVYDHDYPPRGGKRTQPHWEAGQGKASGWVPERRRVFFEDRSLEQDYIELRGKPIRADCAYNIHRKDARQQPPPVSDQRIRMVLTPRSSEGTLRIRLMKLRRAFWAAIGMDGLVTITESADGRSVSGSINLSKRLPPFAVGKSVEISFENVDYRLALRIAGEEVLATSADPQSSAYYGPHLAALRRPTLRLSSTPRVYGTGGAVFELTHLVIDRDVYYYHARRSRPLGSLGWAPPSRDRSGVIVAGWASPESPMLLRAHEYFMLGDNTAASKDSRLWDTWGPHLEERGEAFQLGTVPEDQLIGKAFFVYWPSPNRIDWLDWIPVIGGNVVPDAGRMRWIR